MVNSLIEENIENYLVYQKKWKTDFLEALSTTLGKEVVSATFGLVPNIGGKIILKESPDLRFIDELQFFISLLNNYYSIQIVYNDRFTTYEREHLANTTGWGIKRIAVSPLKENYGGLFTEIEEFIKNKIKHAKFLPFRFDMIKIIDFEVPYKDVIGNNCTVSDGFFDKGMLLNKETEIIGNPDYRLNEL